MSLEKRYAIVVGTNCYNDKKLQFTLKDAQDITNILQQRCQFESKNIIKLEIDISYKENIKARIQNAFDEIKGKCFKKNMDTFLFYYSGHGMYDEAESKSYLELSDTERMSIQAIFNEIHQLGGKNSYLIIDACHVGGAIDFNPSSKDKIQRQFHYNSKGIYCLLGSTAQLPSFEPTPAQTIKFDIQNGFLTHFFLEVIKMPEKYTEGILGFSTIQEYSSIKAQIKTGFEQIPVVQTTQVQGTHPFAIWKGAEQERVPKIAAMPKNRNAIPKGLTLPPVSSDYFIGRANDLEIIKVALQQKQQLLCLMNGEGGIGKTTLAAQYWKENETIYEHLAWLFAEHGVGDALLQLSSVLKVVFEPKDRLKEQIDKIIGALNQLDAPCLLVLDNANDEKDLQMHYTSLRQLPNCHILVTTRVNDNESLNRFVHQVLPFGEADATRLFEHYYKPLTGKSFDLLKSILKAVGFNTLVIELLAKNLKVLNPFESETYSLKQLHEDLQQKGLLGIKSNVIKLFYQSKTLRTAKPEDIIRGMYDLDNTSAPKPCSISKLLNWNVSTISNPSDKRLSDLQKLILSNWAVLPAESISFEVFVDLLHPIDKKELTDALVDLQRKGWIEAHKTYLKMSPVVQTVVRDKNKARLDKDCAHLISNLAVKLNQKGVTIGNPLNIPYEQALLWAQYGTTVVHYLTETTTQHLAELCNRVGAYYVTTGNLEKALFFYQKAFDVYELQFEKDLQNRFFKHQLAAAYSHLGDIYRALGDLEKALSLYERSTQYINELHKRFLADKDYKLNLAIGYSRIGDVYVMLGHLEKALQYYKDYNSLTKQLYKSFHSNLDYKMVVSNSYGKLGNTYTLLGDLKKALNDYNEMTKLADQLNKKEPHNVSYKNLLAGSYQNLGNTCEHLGDLTNAMKYYQTSAQLWEQLYNDSPHNVNYKDGLAISYQHLGNTYKTLGNLTKAFEFYQANAQLLEQLYKDSPLNVDYKNGLAVSYQHLGNTYKEQGDLTNAMKYYKTKAQLAHELYQDNPLNVDYKNGLAVSYQHLGNTYKEQGDLTNAMKYYEANAQFSQELHKDYPLNVSYKNGLAVSYQHLGNTYKELGDLIKAFEFYQANAQLCEQLHQDSPLNVNYKRGLAISYQHLGNTYKESADFVNALRFYEVYYSLMKEIYESHPTTVECKNIFANACEKMGSVHAVADDSAKALPFYELYHLLKKEIYEQFPTNVDYKKGLATAYYDLGHFNKDVLKNRDKARFYFEKAKTLLVAWLDHVPMTMTTTVQDALQKVQVILESL
jgi:tetratricopeptide (TPR) repeat protein